MTSSATPPEDSTPHKLSTSALAKALQVPSSQLFGTLKDYGWIKKEGDGWTLSGKGEFEGGEYVHSKRYGRYIVWPFELTEHPLLQALEDTRYITATSLGKSCGLNAREVNRVMAELGWIKHGFQGWELTASGEQIGGTQLENESSGTFYVVWPQTLLQHAIFSGALAESARLFGGADKTTKIVDDLFATDPAELGYGTLDGHRHSSESRAQICHWLYLAGLAHACQRRLPLEQEYVADFYIPAHQLYIECWDQHSGAGLTAQLQRKEIYKQQGLDVIDVESADLARLDEVLTRAFRKRGVRVA